MFENVNSDVVLFIVGQLIVAAAIWGGIRAELRHMHTNHREQKESLKDAHTRIDQLFQVYWQQNHPTRK